MRFIMQIIPIFTFAWKYRDRIDEVIDLFTYAFDAVKDGHVNKKEFGQINKKFWKVLKG